MIRSGCILHQISKQLKKLQMKQKVKNPALIILPILFFIIGLAVYLHSSGIISMSN